MVIACKGLTRCFWCAKLINEGGYLIMAIIETAISIIVNTMVSFSNVDIVG